MAEKKTAQYLVEIETEYENLIPGHITIERIIWQGLIEGWKKEGKEEIPSFEEFDINVYRAMK